MTTQVVSTEEVTAEVFVEAPVSQLYVLFSTQSGWFDWFAQKGVGQVSKNGILQVFHEKAGPMAFYFQEFVPEKKVAFTFLTPEKLESGYVEISLEEAQGGTEITVQHSGVDPEDADKMHTLWQESLNNLKELMEEARDPRLWNRPFLGVTVEDWVTPEYAAKHNLASESGMHLSGVFEGRGAAKAGIEGGDIITSLAGIAINDYESLLSVYTEHKAGDTIDVEYYHGEELVQAKLTLSSFPVPEVPATALDIAEKLDYYFQKVGREIERLLAGQNEAQADYRPAAGEWSAKEILAHLIASENDSIHWLGAYLSGREVHPYTSATPTRIKTLVALYPTVGALVEKLRETQKELTTMISEVPAEVVNRKASLVRLAFAYSLDVSMHYKDHLSQLAETLAAASDVQAHEGS